jgi:hypothetical protein
MGQIVKPSSMNTAGLLSPFFTEGQTINAIIVSHPAPGYDLIKVDGVSDAELSQAVVDYLPVFDQESRDQARNDVHEYATKTRNDLAGNPSAIEVAGWASKAERAARYADGTVTASDLAVLQSEVDARNRGETVSELVDLQLAKALAFSVANAQIDGLVTRSHDIIDSANLEDIPQLLENIKSEGDQMIADFLAAQAG